MKFLSPRARNWCRCTPAAVGLWAIAAANAAGPGWAAILGGSGQDYAAGVATDAQGNVYVAGLTYSPDFLVTQGALQTKIGSVGASDAFVAKFAPDGALLWSTYLGGCCDDWATGVAVDAAGNVLVTGWTRSTNFPLFHAFQPTLKNGVSPTRYDAFVAKLDPQGALVYSFLHPYGSAYVAGTVSSSAPANSATQTFGVPGDAQAMVFKVSADGSKKLYETTLGGSIRADGMAVAVDRTGAAYLAGNTSSVDFPLVRPLQSSMGARPLWKSTDSGATWTPLDDLPFAYLQALVVDPPRPARSTPPPGIAASSRAWMAASSGTRPAAASPTRACRRWPSIRSIPRFFMLPPARE